MFNILIVDDEKSIRKLMAAILKKEGYQVFLAENGEEGLHVMAEQQIDLIVLDAVMPKMDGFEFAKALRESKDDTPILMITAKHLIDDKKKGFISGVDDYMVKPADEDEMLLRIKALLKRAKIASEHKIIIGDVILDYNSLSVTKNQIKIDLTKKEFYVLYKLLSSANMIFTRFQLMEEFWGYDSESDEHTVSVHINRLRKKFEDFSEFEIITIRGLGYKAVKKI